MSELVDRRLFLRRGALGAAGVAVLGSGILAGCGSDKPSAASGGSKSGADLGEMSLQLSWIEDVEFAGSYIADRKGYYTKAGFSSATLLPGGESVTQDAIVATGKALAGISSPDITAANINKGADLIIVGAQYQQNPFCVMSLAKSPIKTPQDMIGKKIGVQATNDTVWAAFLKVNKIDPSQVNSIAAVTDPLQLTTGDVDGWFSFITNEPNLLKAKGFDTYLLQLQDYHYPLVSETYMVKKSAVKSSPDKIKAFLKAEIQGWHDALADPAEAAKYAATDFGKDQGLDVAEQTIAGKAQVPLFLTDDTRANGIFTVTDELVADTIKSLKLGGLSITAEKLFDFSLLNEVYKENPDLKKSPV
jgi:ABC-type nitrate/sulfonate/bicarbonate transport system substrate-binding protein